MTLDTTNFQLMSTTEYAFYKCFFLAIIIIVIIISGVLSILENWHFTLCNSFPNSTSFTTVLRIELNTYDVLILSDFPDLLPTFLYLVIQEAYLYEYINGLNC